MRSDVKVAVGRVASRSRAMADAIFEFERLEKGRLARIKVTSSLGLKLGQRKPLGREEIDSIIEEFSGSTPETAWYRTRYSEARLILQRCDVVPGLIAEFERCRGRYNWHDGIRALRKVKRGSTIKQAVELCSRSGSVETRSSPGVRALAEKMADALGMTVTSVRRIDGRVRIEMS